MELVSAKEMVTKALRGGYAIGHFDIHNLEWTQAVLNAAQTENSPVILGVTESAVNYFGGYSIAVEIVRALLKERKITIPVALHLDHGSSFESCQQAIDAGFTSVMIDASHLPLQENIEITERVVHYAHQHGVSVEAEVGSIGGKEDTVHEVTNPIYTSTYDCEELVKKTGVDFLAPALGSVHGLYEGEPKIGFNEMKEITKRTNIPLVLHGSSGLSHGQIEKAIKSGTAKINVNADNHVAFTNTVRIQLGRNPDLYDASTYLAEGRDALMNTIKAKMRLFQSSGRG